MNYSIYNYKVIRIHSFLESHPFYHWPLWCWFIALPFPGLKHLQDLSPAFLRVSEKGSSYFPQTQAISKWTDLLRQQVSHFGKLPSACIPPKPCRKQRSLMVSVFPLSTHRHEHHQHMLQSISRGTMIGQHCYCITCTFPRTLSQP